MKEPFELFMMCIIADLEGIDLGLQAAAHEKIFNQKTLNKVRIILKKKNKTDQDIFTITKELANSGCPLDFIDEHSYSDNDRIRQSPLSYSVIQREIQFVQLFLKAGAKIQGEDGLGFTALHFANDYETAKFLLENGADPEIRTIKQYPELNVIQWLDYIQSGREKDDTDFSGSIRAITEYQQAKLLEAGKNAKGERPGGRL